MDANLASLIERHGFYPFAIHVVIQGNTILPTSIPLWGV
jgi:hypothetical protein